MGNRRSGALALGVVVLSVSACATAASPWAIHDQTAELKALSADLDRVCPVVVQNGTEQVLEAMVERSLGEPTNLGILGAGQSVTMDVACADRRVNATAVVVDPGAIQGARLLRASALLELVKETHLRFTAASSFVR